MRKKIEENSLVKTILSGDPDVSKCQYRIWCNGNTLVSLTRNPKFDSWYLILMFSYFQL